MSITSRKKKTSRFFGVSLRQRHADKERPRWLAQYTPVNFRKEYSSEVEAFAHFSAVYCLVNQDNKKMIREMVDKNPIFRGRPEADVVPHFDKEGKRQIAIDHNHIVKLDEFSYTAFRNFHWFISGRKIKVISKVEVTGGTVSKPEFRFGYVTMPGLVMAYWRNLKKLDPYPIGLEPVHLDGDYLNCRYDNLADPRVCVQPRDEDFMVYLRGLTQAEPQAESQAESQAEPQVESQAEPQVESQAEPQVESQAEPQVESQAEPQIRPQYYYPEFDPERIDCETGPSEGEEY